MMTEYIVETFRWVKYWYRPGYYQLLCSDYGWHHSCVLENAEGDRTTPSIIAYTQMVKLWLVSRLNVRQ